MVLFPAHCLIILYICKKFHENIARGFRVIEWTRFPISNFSKEHDFVKNIVRVMVFLLCILSAYALDLHKVS